jgi:hypothetical protein
MYANSEYFQEDIKLNQLFNISNNGKIK